MSLVKSFTHLKGRPDEEKALALLQRIASLVKPIMRKHGWTLPLLAEFFPENDSLVDVNGGEKILIRLRPAWAPDTFYDEEDLVRTMLHELTHNVHGPHDSKFYEFLSNLEQEYDTLKRSGYAGEGFHSVGKRVGTGVSHDLPPHLARLKALEAAEKRRKLSGVMTGGGRLGGKQSGRYKTPREMAAEAAERRAKDEKSCGSGHAIEAEIEARRAAEDSVIHIIDIDALPDPPHQNNRDPSPEIVLIKPPLRTEEASASGPSKILASASTTGLNGLLSSPNKPAVVLSNNEWSCNVCTLVNAPLALQCVVCLSPRPADQSAGWTCLSCGEQGMPHDFWTCSYCGWVKISS
ncbi:WLM domain-containing protein [Hysterangium stoloniferum]|nr:WLM domain-containing protein [Hysterangium stoloniferum]